MCWPDVSLPNVFWSDEVELLLFKVRFKIFINFTLDTLRDLKAPLHPQREREREREERREREKRERQIERRERERRERERERERERRGRERG